MAEREGGGLRRLLSMAAMAVFAIAVVKELRAPEGERTWHGQVGVVPYDLRPPTLGRLREAWWNPDDPRLFTPRAFGVGWAVNLARVRALLQDRSQR